MMINRGHTHSEDIADIVGTTPSYLVRSGITWIFIVLLTLFILTAFIRYPDVIQAPLRINALNAPKPVVSRASGKLTRILIKEGDTVHTGQALAWIENTANHKQVLALLKHLYLLQDTLSVSFDTIPISLNAPNGFRLGELQDNYHSFYEAYLSFRSTLSEGVHIKERAYYLEILKNIEQQQILLRHQQQLYEEEYLLAQKEFQRHKELADRKIISPSEYQQQQAKLITKQHPLQQIKANILANEADRIAILNDLSNLDNQISEEKLRFQQALSSLISAIEQWKRDYILESPQTGILVYAGFIQQNQYINMGQDVFYVNPGSTNFFGEVVIPQYNMGKITVGQKVLIKLKSYPFEEYGILNGTIGRINHVALNDSLFLSRIDLDPTTTSSTIRLSIGMKGKAEIITKEASLLQRLLRNIRLVLNTRKISDN